MIQPLLNNLDIKGKVVTADALHTQVKTARYIVEDKKADYLFIVKDNQKRLRDNISVLREKDFSPCAPNN
jgi:predicted transposase YbfD/YdcC